MSLNTTERDKREEKIMDGIIRQEGERKRKRKNTAVD
jgi:hypothetical protein